MTPLPERLARIPPGRHTFDEDFIAAHQRERIIAATAELIADRGYQGTTTDRIIKRARVSPTTFYANFENREQCFIAAFDQAVARVAAKINQAFEAAEGGWPHQVRAGLQTFLALVVADPATARLCLIESMNAGPAVLTRYEEALHSFIPLLLPGRELSPRGAELPETVEQTLIGGIVWSVYQRLVIGRVDEIEDLAEEMLVFVLDYYLGAEEAAQTISEMAA